MSLLDRLYVEADETTAALEWLLEQWLSDTDPDWQEHVLSCLRDEDPIIFARLDAANAAAAGEPLLSDGLRTSEAPVDGDTTGAISDGGSVPPPTGAPAGDEALPPAQSAAVSTSQTNRNAPAAAGTGSGA